MAAHPGSPGRVLSPGDGGLRPGWYPSGPDIDIDPSIFQPGDPNRVQVKATRLRSTPGGCEVDVTFTNVRRLPV
jgi:hypothetical protein